PEKEDRASAVAGCAAAAGRDLEPRLARAVSRAGWRGSPVGITGAGDSLPHSPGVRHRSGSTGARRMKIVPFEPLEAALYRETVRRALAEDLGWGDVTTEATVPADVRARGVMLVKSPCVIAGLDVAREAFRQLDPAVAFHSKKNDGERCETGDIVATVQ